MRLGERLERGQPRARRGREVDERAAALDRRERVERARREHGQSAVERLEQVVRVACAGCGSAGGSVEDRLMTTTRSSPFRVRNAGRSAAARSTAARGCWRASSQPMPGRCSASTAASARRARGTSPCGITPSSTSRAARRPSGVSTTSWPPKTRSASSGRPASANGVGHRDEAGRRREPGDDRAAPVTVVVATEPRAPTSQTPTSPVGPAVERVALTTGPGRPSTFPREREFARYHSPALRDGPLRTDRAADARGSSVGKRSLEFIRRTPNGRSGRRRKGSAPRAEGRPIALRRGAAREGARGAPSAGWRSGSARTTRSSARRRR